MDPNTNEPLFTNCTRDFIGTLDYIFYSGMLAMSICFVLIIDSVLLTSTSVLSWFFILKFNTCVYFPIFPIDHQKSCFDLIFTRRGY